MSSVPITISISWLDIYSAVTSGLLTLSLWCSVRNCIVAVSVHV